MEFNGALYSASTCQRVGKNTQGGRKKCKNDEEKSDCGEYSISRIFVPARHVFFFEQSHLVNVRSGGRDEENGYVEPIG